MELQPAHVLAASLLLCAPSAAQGLEVRILGTVRSTHGANPPALATVVLGAQVTVDIRLLEPAQQVLPYSWLYSVDYGASSVEVGGAQGTFDPLNVNPGFGIGNDAPSNIGDALSFGGVLDGDFATISLGLLDQTGAAFSSVDVRQMVGTSTGPFPLTVATLSIADAAAGFDAVVSIDEIRFSDGGLGQAYCPAITPNSTGSTSTLLVTGSAQAAANDLTLTATDLPLNTFGFFLASRQQGLVVAPGGSQGNLCLSGAIGRFVGPGQVRNSGALGTFALAIDLTQLPSPTGFVVATAGETWNFQAWHRDSVAGSTTSNLSGGVMVVLQ